jgi:hypothetical protein
LQKRIDLKHVNSDQAFQDHPDRTEKIPQDFPEHGAMVAIFKIDILSKKGFRQKQYPGKKKKQDNGPINNPFFVYP